ncbi:MAG: zinc ribbon domain-containing protein [Ignavibacteriae bacterium]|nr:zinc ribbon domain-containing protein [Ignavibacteriota bacterium]
MPTFDYQCTECGKTYDIFHKVREVVEDVVCPSCGSTTHKRLLSAPNVSVGGRSDFGAKSSGAEFGGGVCCGGGACGLN